MGRQAAGGPRCHGPVPGREVAVLRQQEAVHEQDDHGCHEERPAEPGLRIRKARATTGHPSTTSRAGTQAGLTLERAQERKQK